MAKLELDTYWITFPEAPRAPFGFGVTAYDEADAFALIRSQGIIDWVRDVRSVDVRKGVRISDLDARNVVPNIGPMQFRGVWYPCMNIGWGGPLGGEPVSLKEAGILRHDE